MVAGDFIASARVSKSLPLQVAAVCYRKQGGAVIVHGISEDTVRLAIANPIVMIASGEPED